MFKAFDFCITTKSTSVPTGPDWFHEVKYDGYRLRLERDGDRVRLITRGSYNWTDRFPCACPFVLVWSCASCRCLWGGHPWDGDKTPKIAAGHPANRPQNYERAGLKPTCCRTGGSGFTSWFAIRKSALQQSASSSPTAFVSH